MDSLTLSLVLSILTNVGGVIKNGKLVMQTSTLSFRFIFPKQKNLMNSEEKNKVEILHLL